MRRRIHFIEPPRTKATFSERLERKARRLVVRANGQRYDSVVTRSIINRIALTLDQLDQIRDAHRKFEESLQKHEKFLRGEILRKAPRGLNATTILKPEVEELQVKIWEIEAERRRAISSQEIELMRILEQLANWVGQWQALSQCE